MLACIRSFGHFSLQVLALSHTSTVIRQAINMTVECSCLSSVPIVLLQPSSSQGGISVGYPVSVDADLPPDQFVN